MYSRKMLQNAQKVNDTIHNKFCESSVPFREISSFCVQGRIGYSAMLCPAIQPVVQAL